ncbi:MAG: hypothetical protein CVU91_03825 [Firmicutes bacterium HGW-Firmicutes-16]|nr:MAG: hypothetical protein CVU91_03825 [Firmicutes bacterium HGW-Firmicutes-16]
MMNIRNNTMLYEAKKAKHKPHIVLQILIFIVVIFATQAAAGLIIGVPLGLSMTSELLSKMSPADMTLSLEGIMSSVAEYMKNLPQWFGVVSLFATALVTFLVFVYCRGIEGRSFASMGVRKKGMAKNYGFGYLIGIVMITATVSLAVLLGGAKFTGLNSGVSVFYIVLFLAGYLVQGMSEEVCFRGYFMVSCANKVPVTWAVMISSLAFAIMHLANPGITPLAVFNLVLFGVFAAVYILRTDDLWGACAIHSAWNFFQGNVFGISVSGSAQSTSVFGTSFVTGKGLISGDLFGIEGGICTTIVMLAGIALVLFLPQKASPELPQEEPSNDPAPSRAPLPVYIEK